MNINPIKAIYRFNKEAGLLEQGYSDRAQSAYGIEEMLETFDITNLSKVLNIAIDTSPKEMSRHIVSLLSDRPTKEVEYLDKHLDAIIYHFGALFQMRLSPQQAMSGLNIVMQANMTKLKAGQDDQGKQLKPDNWSEVEKELNIKLQKLLNEIK